MDARRLVGLVLGAGWMVLGACGGGGPGGGGGNPDGGSQNVCTIEGVSLTASVTSVVAALSLTLSGQQSQTGQRRGRADPRIFAECH